MQAFSGVNAPTEIAAEQHAIILGQWLAPLGMKWLAKLEK